jgi:simple sugar transport system permease protein
MSATLDTPVAAGPRSTRAARLLVRLLVPLAAVGLGLLVGAIAIVLTGGSPMDAYGALIRGAVGTPSNLNATLARAVPIVVVGVGLAIAFRAGALNLGGEGQMIIAAVVTAVVAGWVGALPAPLAIVVAAGAGCLAGAAWALGPTLLQARFEVPLLITTLLLNYVGVLLAAWLVAYPLREVGGGVAQTPTIPDPTQLPYLAPGGRLHAGVLLLALLPIGAWWLLARTVAGYEMRMTGLNAAFSEYGGVDGRRTLLRAMLLSGAVCGLAGALVVLGVHHRYIDGSISAPGYAWTGFTAALLAGGDPIGTLVAGLFLAGLQTGAAGMERNADIPLQVVDVVQACIILMIAIRLTLGRWIGRRVGLG